MGISPERQGIMPALNLKADIQRVTLDDLIELENPTRSVRFIRDFLARFATDEAGEYLKEAEARKVIGALTLAEARDAVEALGISLREVQDNAIPLATK
jgi:hypothetical protein